MVSCLLMTRTSVNILNVHTIIASENITSRMFVRQSNFCLPFVRQSDLRYSFDTIPGPHGRENVKNHNFFLYSQLHMIKCGCLTPSLTENLVESKRAAKHKFTFNFPLKVSSGSICLPTIATVVCKSCAQFIKSKASLRLRLFCMMKYMHQYKQKR